MMRTLVIGLDGFHEDLLKYTPNIKTQYDESTSGALHSTKPPVTAPAWASFQTGQYQGNHGIYDFVSHDENFNVEFNNGRDLKSKTFYEYLDEAGYDCILYNLPFSLPPRINGDIVPSWLDPDESEPAPHDLYDILDIQPPDYPELSGPPLERLDKLESCFYHNKQQFLKILQRENHDFFFHLISTTDWLQHIGYKQLKENPESKVAEKTRSILLQVDNYVEEIQSEMDNKDNLLLLSDHGFKTFGKKFYINDWLIENGYTHNGDVKIGDKNNDKTINIGDVGRRLYQINWLRPVLSSAKNIFESVSQMDISYESGINVEKSRAYCLSKDEYAIRIDDSLQAENKNKVIDEIVNRLNNRAGISALRRDDVYSGPYVENAGDIILESETHKLFRGPIGMVEENSSIAHHDPVGIIIDASNKNPNQKRFQGAELVDVAPTILALLNVAIPSNIDGSPIKEIQNDYTVEEVRESYKPKFKSDSKTEKEGVKNRLENLGYL